MWGAFSFANLEFESATEKLGGKTVLTDVANIYGPTSTQVTESPLMSRRRTFRASRSTARAGNSICYDRKRWHSPICFRTSRAGSTGFNGLFGAKYVAPAVGLPGGLQDLSGNVLTNADSGLVPDLPGSIRWLPRRSARSPMQEGGVPVTFAYIADAHDNHEV